MISTHHSSCGPPLPPRQAGPPHPTVVMQPPRRGPRRAVMCFFFGIVLMHLLITVGGFALLYHTEMLQLSEGKAAFHSSENLPSSWRTLARMIVAKPSGSVHKGCYLRWDLKHSVRRNINYFHQSNWLTIQQPGDYLVVSRVTFSKGDPQTPLASMVKLKRSEAAEETVAMQTYCGLSGTESRSGWRGRSGFIPQMCTASQQEVMSLERGNQLSVWVADLSLVDYTDTATSFGMYKL